MTIAFAIQIRVTANNLASTSKQQPRFEIIKAVGLPVGSNGVVLAVIDRSVSVPDLLPGTTITLHGGNLHITAPGVTAPVLNDNGTLEG